MGENKLLIFNADDYGRTPEISAGILECFRNGVVRNTTAMMGFATANDMSALKESGIACGLHFTLTAGAPLADWPDDLLDAEGRMMRNFDGVPQEIMSDELCAQWDALVACGIIPTHIDSHHHVHADPRVLSVVIELAIKRGVPVRPANDLVAAQLKRYGIVHPDSFSTEFYGREKISSGTIYEVLRNAASGSLEIMCHPGYSSAALEASSSYAKERMAELAVLTGGWFALEIERLGWLLGNYRDIR